MRRSTAHPLEPNSNSHRKRENEVNYAATRNQSRKRVGNPIPIPQSPYDEKANSTGTRITDRMKPRPISHLPYQANVRKFTVEEERRDISGTRTSARQQNKRLTSSKKEEKKVIEISDNEENQQEQHHHRKSHKPKKRRLIKHEESDQEEEHISNDDAEEMFDKYSNDILPAVSTDESRKLQVAEKLKQKRLEQEKEERERLSNHEECIKSIEADKFIIPPKKNKTILSSSIEKTSSLYNTAKSMLFGSSQEKNTKEEEGNKDYQDQYDDIMKEIEAPKRTNRTRATSETEPPLPISFPEVVVPELPFDEIDLAEVKHIGHDKHLLTYPFEGKKSVTVYERDLDRLNDGEFLNDTLLDVYPKIWQDQYPDSCQYIHTFSSFFYTKLSKGASGINYDTVVKWTQHVNIFEKKLVIIPIAQHHHWYLVVVTNPVLCISKKKEQVVVPPKPGRRRRNVLPGALLDREKPYIMILDSLGGGKSETCKNVCEYLKMEAVHKLNIDEQDFLEPEFVSTFCPNQQNFVDCGVFCLHYINSFYQDPEFMMDVLYNYVRDDKGWDRENNLPSFRLLLKRILKKKMQQYVEYLKKKLTEEEEIEREANQIGLIRSSTAIV